MQSVLFWFATTLYAVSTLLFFVWIGFRKEGASTWAVRAAASGLVPHAMTLALRWKEVGHGPFSTRYEVISSNAMLLVGIFLLAMVWAKSLKSLGIFIMPIAFLGMGWSVSTFGVKADVPIIFKSYWLYLHIGFAKAFGVTALLAAACAAAFLVRSRNPKRLSKLPSRLRLDLYSHQFLLVSFLCLGVMIVAGSLWAHQSWGRYWAWDPIETSSLVTWLVFGVVLHFRVIHRWSARRMAWLTFVALAFALATVYVVVLVVPSIHNAYMVGR